MSLGDSASWLVLLGYGALIWAMTPKRVSAGQFFHGQSEKGAEPGLLLLVASAAITWIFAKSIANSAALGKAFGTFGAFVAGEETLIEALIQRARTYLYTTAPPPALAEATRAALRIARAEPWRRERLRALTERFRAGARSLGVSLGVAPTPIQALIVGTAAAASDLSAALEARGILVSAIRPPTVPEGTSRLRVTFSALHEEAHVDRLLEALAEVWPRRDGARG